MGEQIDLLRQIEKNTSKRAEFSLVLSSDSTDFTIYYDNPLKLDKNWSVGLLTFTAPFSYSNITLSNNIFRYFNGTTWKTLTLSVGAYNIDDLNSQIQLGIAVNGDIATAITIIGNNINGTTVVNITNASYRVDFTVANSLRNILGFNSVILLAGYNNSPNQAQISTLNQILVNCSIIGGSYLNNLEFPTIYSFPPKYAPYTLMLEQPNKIVYLPLKSYSVNSIRIWITDQNGQLISLNNESVTVRLHFKYY